MCLEKDVVANRRDTKIALLHYLITERLSSDKSKFFFRTNYARIPVLCRLATVLVGNSHTR